MDTSIIEHIINKSFRIPSKTRSFHQNLPNKEKCIEHGRSVNSRLRNNPIFSFISCNSSKSNKFVKTPDELRKKYMNDTVTSVFIESLDQLYDEYTEKIVNIIYSNIQTYLKLKNKSIRNYETIKNNDIILLFKGGNVINNYIKRVIGRYRNLESNLDAKNIKTLKKLRKIDTDKKSDWDFSIEINIQDRELYRDVLGDIKNLAWYITYQLKLFFDSEISSGNFDNVIYSYLESLQYSFIKNERYKDEINSFGDDNNNGYKTVTKIKSFGFDIDSINITKSDKALTNYSKVISTRTENDMVLNDDATIRVPFILFGDNTTKYELNHTNVGMVHIDRMTINKKKSASTLDICRIKIGNLFEYEDGTSKRIQCELVDIAIMENQDIHLKNVRKKNVMVTLYRGKKYPIYPSVDYLFFDLYISLFSSMFPWDTVKYEKRIKRMGYILCFIYTRNYSDSQQLNLIANLKKLLKVIYNFHIANNIKNKIQFVKNNITIIDNKIILSKNFKNLDKELKIILSEYFEIILFLDYLFNITDHDSIAKYFDNIINKTRDMQQSYVGNLSYYKNLPIEYYIEKLGLFEKQLLKMLKLIKDIVSLDIVSKIYYSS